jgi:DNA mismatch repair protein MutS2
MLRSAAVTLVLLLHSSSVATVATDPPARTCRREMPAFAALASALHPRRVPTLGGRLLSPSVHSGRAASERPARHRALIMSGGGRESDAVLFMPGASPKARTQSKRFEQWYSTTDGSEDGAEEGGADQDVAPEDPKTARERLLASTERSLDWQVVKTALANCSVTPMGRHALTTMAPLLEVAEVERAFSALEEVRLLAEQGVNLPVSQVHDIVALAGTAGKGDVLDLDELKDCGSTLVAMQQISKLLSGRNDTATLTDISQDIDLDPEIVRLFERSFDAAGQLSIRQYPQLDMLRKEIIQIEASVTKTMDSIVKDSRYASTLQDKFYTIRENRFVLPVAIVNKNKVQGIVHGISGTGSTVYIEPQQVIDLNNRLRLAQGELKAEEQRIRTTLSQKLGSQARQVRLATKAVVEIDCAGARERLAGTMQAIRPIVADENNVELKRARHPVLVLRGVKPVPNSVSLVAGQPALVISGPNAGGKTVVLKTVGLCALLVQHGCWVPCEGELLRGAFLPRKALALARI